MAEDNPLEGQDPNEVQGVDPSQSAFQPMLDENIPEDLNRTTTTTTMYISGAPTTPQETVPIIGENIEEVSDPFMPSMISDDSVLRARVEELLSQYKNISRRDEPKLKKIKETLLSEDPDGDWRDERFDDKINLTKRFPDLFPKYAAYTKGIEDMVLVDGIPPDQLIDDGIIGPYSTGTLAHLWDASGYGKENVNEYGKKIAYADQVLEAIQNEDLNKLKVLGDVNQLKIDYPNQKAVIELMVVKDALKKDLSLEELEELKKNNSTQTDSIDYRIKDDKIKDKSKSITSYMTDDEALEWALGGYKSLSKEQVKLIYEREKDDLLANGITIQDLVRGDVLLKDFLAQEDKAIELIAPFADFLGVDARAYSEAINLNEDELETFKSSQKQDTDILEFINKKLVLSGNDSIAIEDLQDIYMYGDYNKSQGEKFKEVDNAVWDITSQMINPKGLFDLPELFYTKHGTTKSEFINKREIILEFSDAPMQIVSNMYSPDKIEEMYEVALERMTKNVGDTELDLYYYITGGSKPTDYYDEDIKSGSKSNNQEILNRIHVNDETKTVNDLNQLFQGTPFRFREAARGYDAVEIYTIVKDEFGEDFEMNSSGAIFIDDFKNYDKFVSFMAKANPTAADKRFIGERRLPNEDYGNPNIFKITDKPLQYDDKGKLFSYLYMMQNIDRFSMGGGEASINIDAAAKLTDNLLENSWIGEGLLERFNSIMNYSIDIDYKRKALQESGLIDVALGAVTSGALQAVKYTANLQSQLMVSLASDDMLGISFDKYKTNADGTSNSLPVAKDKYLKDLKRENNRNFENIRKNASGVNLEWLNENAGIAPKALNFLLESAAVGIIGGPASRAAFFMYASNGIEDQMLSREFDGLTEWEKKPVSVLYGFVIGQLEKAGFDTAKGAFSNNSFGGIARWLINESIKDLPENASREVIETAIKNNVKAKIIDAGIRFTGGGFSEGAVEGIQSFAEVGIQKLTNKITNFQYFQTPELTTVEGMKEMLIEVGESFGYGAIGGHVYSASGIAFNGIKTGIVNVENNKKFKNYYDVISDEQLLSKAKSAVFYRMQKGEIDKDMADAEIDALDQAYSISTEIPTDFTTNQKKQAYELLTERKKIKGQIEGKEKNLISTQTERIKDIDRQLELISKGGFKDAIQESETKEEVLPDEQSEVGLQDVGQGDTQEQEAAEVQQEISPENSSNYANLTEDNDGNMVFYHVGDKGYETIKPAAGKTTATSREEAGALSKVGGMTMMYTQESDGESMVTGEATYEVKVPKSKVYDFNTDKDNFIEEAKERHEKENPGKAFDPNTQVAYVSQVAAENGYEVVVSEWDGRTRAQSVKEMPISDVKTRDGNKITKDFKENYQSNKEKGFESVIPANKEDQLDEVYQKIKTEKGKSKEYDETYFLFDAMSRRKNYNQDQITKMINESNLSQEVKEEYNVIMEAKPEQRRSVKTRDNIAGVEIQYPNAQQEQERKEERTKPEYVNEAANKNQEEDIESFQAELEGEFGMLTGENPMGKPLTEQENQQLNEKAEEYLKEKGYKPRKITGKYGQAENSFFVPGLTKEDAISFAKEFNQESVAHSEGMVFQDGMMNPRTKSTDNFKMDQYTPESNFVSVVKTKDGLKTFTVGYDFKNKVESTPKPKAKKTTREASRLQQQVDNAKKAISKIIPDVEIITHKDEASYRKATGETDSKEQTSRGEYNPNTKTIHINPSKANNRTVAHEVFHAILLDKVKTNKATRDLTERMIKSLLKSDQLENIKITYRGEEITVAEYLEKFASNYDENIQNEEKLAELVGILAENYAQMNKPSQNLIKRFLDRLAKMFGLKPFTDGEVVDVLNTIAGKVALGEEISDVDLKVISKNKTAEIKEANKRFQADFTDLKSGVTYSFDKNTNEFKKIEQKYITRNKSISDFNNVFMILHQPDSAFSGKISKKLSDGSEILVEGKGGIFYPIKFHEKGYFWASTSKAAQAMAESMNKAINKDGKIYMALTTAPTNKVLSSTNAANGVMNLFISLSTNPKFNITGIESILIKSYNKAFGDKIDSSNNLDEIVKIIEEKLGAEKSSFDDRKTFSTSIIDSVVKSIQRKKSNQDAQNSLADFFGEGMMAEDLVTKFKKGSKISKANLTEAVSQMLTEPMLRDGKSKTENGSIYAILEIDGEVEAVDAKSETDHESYPKAIKSKGDSKTTLHLLTDRVKWNNVTIDPDTGKTVNKSGKVKSKDPKKKGTLVERWTQIMSPSAGITTQGVKIDTSEATTPSKRKQVVIGENADLKQNVKDFLLDANQMESEGKSREEIRLATGWERGADNKWGYELNDVIDIDVNNIEKNKTYDIQDVVSFQELFDAYPDTKKLKVKFIDNARKSGIAAYFPKKGLIEVNLSKIGLVDYVQDNMAKSRLSKNPDVLAAAVREANLLIKQNELEKEGVSKKSDRWKQETKDVYSDNQLLIDRKIISDYLKDNDVSYSDFFKDVRSIERLILKKKDIDIAKGIDELNSKILHEIQHAIADIEGFAKGGSASNIQETFTDQEKKEYNEIVNEVNRMAKLLNEGKVTREEYIDARDKEVEYRYKKYEELAGETMSRNVERRRKLSPEQRREKTLESTMDVAMEDQKILYEDDKNISIKDKKVEEKKPKEKKGFFSRFKKRKQKDDGPVEPRIDIRNLKKKSDKKIKETNKGKGPILRRLRRSLLDRQNDIKRVIKDFVPNPKKVSNIINRIVTKSGASGYANELFKQNDKKIFGGLKTDQIENLELIIYARRIVAINENRRKTGMNPYTGMGGLNEQDALQNLEKFEQDLGKKEFDSLSKRADEYFEAMKKNLKMLRDSGRITKETYKNLEDVEYSPIMTLKYMIPKDTITDEEINNAVSTLGVNKKDIMKLSDMNENEILFDARFLLMMNTNIYVRRSFENEMLNEFAQGYESIDKAGKEALSDFIIEGPVKKVPTGFRKVEYFQDGVEKEMVMREDYARQLLDIKNQNNFLKGLGKISGANVLRFFATGGNPLFIVGNTAVDFANIAFFSDVYSAIKPLATVQLAYDFVKNFLRKTGNTNNYNKIKMEFMEHGGAMDFLSTDGLRMVQDMKLKNRILNKTQKGLAAYARFMSYVGETGEMSFRLAVYERVKDAEINKFKKENGRSPNQKEMDDIMFEAAAQSRETIDFSQGGTWVKQMDQALPYFNAAMQGLRRPLDFARKNPVGFTSNVVQYAVMAAGMTATSLGTLLRSIGDDEEEKKKLQDILDSISEYEKANYHIIFTGNKDKDGNYEYVRIKKLPLISILGTATEQYTTKYLLKSQGIDYNVDNRSIKKSIEMSAPLDILGPFIGDESAGQALGGVVKRNPLAAAWLTYTYNEDTFTGDKVFYEPKNKKIKPYAEGLYDEKVNDIYKIVAPALDMSPKRAQAAVEKLITSESTNPSISIFYALTNGLFDTEGDAFKENADTFDNGMGHFLDVVSKKMVRHTNPNLLRYKDQDKIDELKERIDTDEYLTNIKIKKDIDKNINSKIIEEGDSRSDKFKTEYKKLDNLLDGYKLTPNEKDKYFSYASTKDLKNEEVFKDMRDIIYEKSPKMMAARLYQRYGNNLDKEEMKELNKVFSISNASDVILKTSFELYYNKYYLNKSQKKIDKFEESFGKIR